MEHKPSSDGAGSAPAAGTAAGATARQGRQANRALHRNLDALCAEVGSAIVDSRGTDKQARELETTTRNALAVMRDQGLFAFFIFLQNQLDKGGQAIWSQMKELWQRDSVGPLLPQQGRDSERVIQLTEDLQDLLLARKVAERALVYALYGLRAERKKAERRQRAAGE